MGLDLPPPCAPDCLLAPALPPPEKMKPFPLAPPLITRSISLSDLVQEPWVDAGSLDDVFIPLERQEKGPLMASKSTDPVLEFGIGK